MTGEPEAMACHARSAREPALLLMSKQTSEEAACCQWPTPLSIRSESIGACDIYLSTESVFDALPHLCVRASIHLSNQLSHVSLCLCLSLSLYQFTSICMYA